MNTYVLISGNSPECKERNIEKKIITLSNKANPLVLFFPTATKDSEKSIKQFSLYFNDYTKRIENALLFTESIDEIKNKINKADILYFGGGNTEVLVTALKDTRLDIFLKTINNKIICGISAGAIMLSSYGMGDSYTYQNNYHIYNFKMVQGLNFINITLCPHYQKEDLIYFNDELIKYNLNAIALEDDTAIIIYNKKITLIKNMKKNNGYFFVKKRDYLMETFLEEINYEDVIE